MSIKFPELLPAAGLNDPFVEESLGSCPGTLRTPLTNLAASAATVAATCWPMVQLADWAMAICHCGYLRTCSIALKEERAEGMIPLCLALLSSVPGDIS